jgi:hypothetical protein
MSKLDAQTRAVHKALGITSRGVDQHAKSIKGLIQNQKVLGIEQKRIVTDLNALRTAYVLAGKETTELGRSIGVTTRELQAFSKTFRGMRLRAIGSDFANISLRMSKLGKDAQFVGRSLLINLTLPLAAFARTGLQTFKEVDTQLTRLTKVMEDVAPTLDIAAQKITGLKDAKFGDLIKPQDIQNARLFVKNFNDLNTALTQMSLQFGVAKQMVVSIGADFAELGVTSQDNIENLTKMTLQLEKLGTMDIKGAQDLTQALYFQSKRALEANGAFDSLTTARERESRALEAARAQMLLFNAIENATALTLRDLGDALPEVGSMATSFGISMTEAAALLAPMKAAGLDIGASSNSIKVSLQRLLAPTKQNSDMINKLAKEYGVLGDAQNDFTLSTKTGLIGLDATVKMFRAILKSKAGPEGALRLMSDLFEKRQGPRMYLAIEQLDLFNRELEKTASFLGKVPPAGASAEIQLAQVADNAAKSFVNFNSTIVPKTIRSFKDIGNVARIATATAGQKIEIEPGKELIIQPQDIKNAQAMRKAVGDFVVKKKQAEGIDIISEVKTETGRALMIQLAGGANAAVLAQAELDRSLLTTSASIEKIKNAFKLFAADLISRLAPAIEAISEKVVKMYETWMSPQFEETRKKILDLIIAVGSFLGSLGPVILAMGTFQAVVGKVGLGLARFFPKLKNLDGGFVGLGRSAELATTSINNFYEKYIKGVKAATNQANIAAPSISALVSGQISKGKQLISTETALGTIKARSSAIQAARNFGITDIASGPSAIQQKNVISKYLQSRPTATRLPKLATQAAFYGIPASFYDGGILRPEIESAFSTYQGLSPSQRSSIISTSKAKNLAKKQIQAVQAFQTVQPIFAAKGVGISQQISDTGQVGAMRYAFRDREITTKQARGIARGGMRGVVSRIGIGADVARAGIGDGVARARGVMATVRTAAAAAPSTGAGVVSGMKAGTVAILAQTRAWQAATGATRAYVAQTMALGGTPTLMGRISAAIAGLTKSTRIATIAAKIFKTTLLFTGVGAIIAGIAAVVFLVIKNMDKIRGATKAWDALKRAFGLIKDAAMEVIRPIQDLFAEFGSGKDGAEAAGAGIANVFTGIAKAVEFVAGMIKIFVQKVIQPYLYGIINIVMAVVSIFKGNWGDAFKFLIAGVASVAKGVINLFVEMGVGIVKVIVAAISKVLDAFGEIPIVGKVFNMAKGGLQAISNLATSAMKGVAGKITGALDKAASLGIKKSTNAIKLGGTALAQTATDVGEAGNEAITSALGNTDGVEDAMDRIKNKIKEGLSDAAQKLYDFLVDRLSDSIKKFVSESTKALNKQKESALKVFDVQIRTLMKLEQAEESLTRTKEYETNRRKLIDDASLRQEQYRRNRALAIYEGRIDDARLMDLEEINASRDSSRELASLDESRRKELAKENLDALRAAIEEAKELAGRFFDESLEKFQNAAEYITRIAPVTMEQYSAQLEQLRALTTQYSDTNNLEFGKMFEKFSTTITDRMPNTIDDFGNAIGGFSEPLDKLVNLAQQKYGLGSDAENTFLGVTKKLSDSVIGVTLGMLVDMGGKFETEAPGVVEKYGEITGGIKGGTDTFKTEVLSVFAALLSEVKTTFITPFKAAFDASDPTSVYNQAIADGNETIKREFEKTLKYNKSLAKKMEDALDPAVKKWIELKAAIDDAAESAKNAGGGGGMGDIPKTGGYVVTPYGAMPTSTPGIRTILETSRLATRGGVGVKITSRKAGGTIPGSINTAVPAILHGGEFVLNAAAVKRIGVATLMKLNNYQIPQYKMGGYVPSRFSTPRSSTPSVGGVAVNSVSTVNIQVENFIGQEEWFKSMMKEYNINVVPRNQKAAGLESRTFTSYSGINQGL